MRLTQRVADVATLVKTCAALLVDAEHEISLATDTRGPFSAWTACQRLALSHQKMLLQAGVLFAAGDDSVMMDSKLKLCEVSPLVSYDGEDLEGHIGLQREARLPLYVPSRFERCDMVRAPPLSVAAQGAPAEAAPEQFWPDSQSGAEARARRILVDGGAAYRPGESTRSVAGEVAGNSQRLNVTQEAWDAAFKAAEKEVQQTEKKLAHIEDKFLAAKCGFDGLEGLDKENIMAKALAERERKKREDSKTSPQASPQASPRSPRAGSTSPLANQHENGLPRRRYHFSKQGPRHAIYQVASSLRLRRARVYKKAYAGGMLRVMPGASMSSRIADNWKHFDKGAVYAADWGPPIHVHGQRVRGPRMADGDFEDEDEMIASDDG